MTTHVAIAPTLDTILTVRAAPGPILLAETDIDRVAAAGGKGGIAGDFPDRPTPPKPK